MVAPPPRAVKECAVSRLPLRGEVIHHTLPVAALGNLAAAHHQPVAPAVDKQAGKYIGISIEESLGDPTLQPFFR